MTGFTDIRGNVLFPERRKQLELLNLYATIVVDSDSFTKQLHEAIGAGQEFGDLLETMVNKAADLRKLKDSFTGVNSTMTDVLDNASAFIPYSVLAKQSLGGVQNAFGSVSTAAINMTAELDRIEGPINVSSAGMDTLASKANAMVDVFQSYASVLIWSGALEKVSGMAKQAQDSTEKLTLSSLLQLDSMRQAKEALEENTLAEEQFSDVKRDAKELTDKSIESWDYLMVATQSNTQTVKDSIPTYLSQIGTYKDLMGQIDLVKKTADLLGISLGTGLAGAIGIGVTAISTFIGWCVNSRQRMLEQKKTVEEVGEEYEYLIEQVRETESKLGDVNERILEIKELGPLTLTEKDELEQLEAMEESLGGLYKILQAEAEMAREEMHRTAVETLELGTTYNAVFDNGLRLAEDGSFADSIHRQIELYKDVQDELEILYEDYKLNESVIKALERLSIDTEQSIYANYKQLNNLNESLKEGTEEYDNYYHVNKEALGAAEEFVETERGIQEAFDETIISISEVAQAQGELTDSYRENNDARVKSSEEYYENLNTLTTIASEKLFASQQDMNGTMLRAESNFISNMEALRASELNTALVETFEKAGMEEMLLAQFFADQLYAVEQLSADDLLKMQELSAEERYEAGVSSSETLNELYEKGLLDLHNLSEELWMAPEFTGQGAEAYDDMAEKMLANSAVIDAIVLTMEQAYEKSLEIAGQFYDIGMAMMEGIRKGIEDGTSAAVRAMETACKALYNTGGDFFEINSPSKLFRREIGGGIMEGWMQGIENNSDALNQTMTRVAGDSVDAAQVDFVPEFKDAIYRRLHMAKDSDADKGISRAEMRQEMQRAFSSFRSNMTMDLNFNGSVGTVVRELLMPEIRAEIKRTGQVLV